MAEGRFIIHALKERASFTKSKKHAKSVLFAFGAVTGT